MNGVISFVARDPVRAVASHTQVWLSRWYKDVSCHTFLPFVTSGALADSGRTRSYMSHMPMGCGRIRRSHLSDMEICLNHPRQHSVRCLFITKTRFSNGLKTELSRLRVTRRRRSNPRTGLLQRPLRGQPNHASISPIPGFISATVLPCIIFSLGVVWYNWSMDLFLVLNFATRRGLTWL